MYDSEQSKKLRFQLSVLFDLNVFAIQPNFVTKGMASRLNVFVVGPFLKFLSLV